MRKIILFCSIFFLLNCSKKQQKYGIEDAQLAHDCEKKLTDFIVVDIFSPPVASRIYANVSIAMYEAARFSDSSSVSIADKLKGFEKFPVPEKGKDYDFSVAMIKAFSETAQKITFSAKEVKEFETQNLGKLKIRTDSETFERSIQFGNEVAKVVIKRLSTDGYKETRGMDRFEVTTNSRDRWVPTSPDYADALEPNWAKMKPFLLDSANQFLPPPYPKFDLQPNSTFSKEIEEVYTFSKTLTREQEEITAFWDDNPFVAKFKGHVEFQDKKMTPGGHWMAICRTFLINAKTNLANSLRAYASTSVALHDGFVSCWDAKYKYIRVRPQTVINKTRDEKWFSYLQTPPFPEYTSGHSTISAAAAEVLSEIFGTEKSFTDSTELEFGLTVRSFKSIREAALQASESRIYGGIHFRSGCEAGNKQGIKVGKLVVEKLFTKNSRP